MNVQFALEILLRASMWGAVALGAAWILCFAGRHHLSASVRVWIWRLALAKMILGLVPLSPLALSLLPAVERAPQPQKAIVVAPERKISPIPKFSALAEALQIAPATSDAPILTAPPKPLQRVIPAAPKEAPQPVAPPFRPDWPLIVLIVWALGALVQTVQLTRGYTIARGLRRAASPLGNELAASITAQCCARLGVRRAPQLAISTAGPLLLGAQNPLILLPEPLWHSWNEAELRLVLAHEVAHHKRADLRWNFLLGAAQILFWFHPLLWLARREWRANSEQACDELTLRGSRESAALYGALLLRLATQNAANGPAMVGVSEFALLKGRLMQLKSSNGRRHWPRSVVALAILVGAASLLPWQLTARAQTETKTPARTTLMPVLKNATRTVSGRVVGPDGLPVAGATVYLMASFRNGDKPTATIKTDAQGHFSLRDPRSVPAADLALNFQWGQLFVDAGTRGMAFREVISIGSAQVEVQLLPTATPRLTFVDVQNRPVVNAGVRLWKVGTQSTYWLPLPDVFLKRFVGRTNARGEVVFPALPQGLIAQFMLTDEKQVPGNIMIGERRGGRFAPLSTEDFVTLNAPIVRKTIRLLPVANLSGVVKGGERGVPLGNLPVVARRINAAEARGDIANRDSRIASTRSNAQGVYQLDGLRPGNYYVWAYPTNASKRDYAGLDLQKPLKSGQNRVDFSLSAGALLEGRVVSAATGEPVKGQTLGLETPGENYQYEISDAVGRFRFRSVPGKLHFWVHANGTNSPPPGYGLPAQNKFDFSLKEGQTKTFLIQLPDKAPTKPITGRVVGPDGAPVANALVSVEGLGGFRDPQVRGGVRSDSDGKFIVSGKQAARPARLWASSGELQTARGTVALAGDDVTLKLESGASLRLAGRVVDYNSKKPLAGASVRLLRNSGNLLSSIASARTGSDGRFEFLHQRAHEQYMMEAGLPGYTSSGLSYVPLNGPSASGKQTTDVTLELRRASSFVGGRVLRADGKPAAGLRIYAPGARFTVLTDATGRFYLPQTFSGSIEVSITSAAYSTPGKSDWWLQQVRAGRHDVVIRLNKAKLSRIDSVPPMTSITKLKPRIGDIAPEIHAAQWLNSAPLSLTQLRGQVVLLDFNLLPLIFSSGAQPEVEEIGRAFTARGLRVIGIQSEFMFSRESNNSAKLAVKLRDAGVTYPVALDVRSSNPFQSHGQSYQVGATARSYGMTPRVVIDRAGRIAYIGDSLSDAVSVAAGLLAAK